MKNSIKILLIVLLSTTNYVGYGQGNIDLQSSSKNNQIIEMPSEDNYDYNIAMSYSGPQPISKTEKRYYILVTSGNPQKKIESLELRIQNKTIDLDYANYGGKDFYIAYFNLDYSAIYKFQISINGKKTKANLKMLKELFIDLPENLKTDSNVQLEWKTEKDPMVTYIEGFQKNEEIKLMKKEILNFSSDTRSFLMPASWLWSEEKAKTREIQLGITNFKIKNRICFTISDGVYKKYINN